MTSFYQCQAWARVHEMLTILVNYGLDGKVAVLSQHGNEIEYDDMKDVRRHVHTILFDIAIGVIKMKGHPVTINPKVKQQPT